MDWSKIIYPGLAALFTALLFWLLGLAKSIPAVVVPSSAVVAFDLDDCPPGWSDFSPATGRTIIGDGAAAGLSPRALREQGGHEVHTLTIPEMPAHDHGGIWGGGQQMAGMLNDYAKHTSGHVKIQTQGEARAFELMPPFVALRYCKKQ